MAGGAGLLSLDRKGCLGRKRLRNTDVRDLKVMPWELQHRLVVVDLDKKILKKIMRKEWIIEEEC